MSNDQFTPAFQQLCDVAAIRKVKVGIRVSDQLLTSARGDQFRTLHSVEAKTNDGKVLIEMIDQRGLNAAAHTLLCRLPQKAA